MFRENPLGFCKIVCGHLWLLLPELGNQIDSFGGREQIFNEFNVDSFVSRPVNGMIFSKLEHLFRSTCNFEALAVGASKSVRPEAMLIQNLNYFKILIKNMKNRSSTSTYTLSPT